MKLAPGSQLPDSTRRAFKPAGFYWQNWRGKWILRRSPQPRSRQPSDLQQANRDDMARLAQALNNATSWDRAYCEALAWGTQLTWRDVLSLVMIGRFVYVRQDLPPMAYPDLDLIGATPGAIVVREDVGWNLLTIGINGQVLTLDGGKPRWRNPAASGAAAAGGLWSAQIGNTRPTQANTGLTGTAGAGVVVADTLAGINMTCTGTGGIIYKTAPTAPYTITMLIAPDPKLGLPCIGWYDGTKLQFVYVGSVLAGVNCQVHVQNNSTIANFASTSYNVVWNLNPALYWVRLIDDGTNIAFRLSADGVIFSTAYTVAKSSGYLGGSGYSNICVGNPGIPGGASILAFKQE